LTDQGWGKIQNFANRHHTPCKAIADTVSFVLLREPQRLPDVKVKALLREWLRKTGFDKNFSISP